MNCVFKNITLCIKLSNLTYKRMYNILFSDITKNVRTGFGRREGLTTQQIKPTNKIPSFQLPDIEFNWNQHMKRLLINLSRIGTMAPHNLALKVAAIHSNHVQREKMSCSIFGFNPDSLQITYDTKVHCDIVKEQPQKN